MTKLFGAIYSPVSNPLPVLCRKDQNKSQTTKQPSKTKPKKHWAGRAGFWRNPILILHWCPSGVPGLGFTSFQEKLLRRIALGRLSFVLLLQGGSQKRKTRSRVSFVFFLWTQGGSRALSLAGCRVKVAKILPPSLLC